MKPQKVRNLVSRAKGIWRKGLKSSICEESFLPESGEADALSAR